MFDVADGAEFELSLLDNCGVELLFELFDDTVFLWELGFKYENPFGHFFVLNDNVSEMLRQFRKLRDL